MKMLRFAVLVLLMLLSALPAFALEEFKSFTLQNAAGATGNGTAVETASYVSIALQVTISATATVTFEGTQDGSTWASAVCTSTGNTSGTLVTSAEATGLYQCSVAGLAQFRARISSFGSGTVTVTGRVTTAVIGKKGTGGGGGGSVATDTIFDAAGDLVYGTGADAASRLAPGTAGQVLQMNSGATAPEWTGNPAGLTSVQFGADPADAGRVRLSNTESVCWEAATPGTDLCITLNSSNEFVFTAPINITGTAGPFLMTGVATPSAPATTEQWYFYADSVDNLPKYIYNGESEQTFFTTANLQTTAATPSANDNDTSIATTAYVQTELTAYASDTVTFTNKTTDCEGTGNVCTIPRRIWLPAAGCNNATAGSIWDIPSSNPAVPACITGTNTQKGVLDFADSASLSAQLTYALPTTWTGTVDARIKWLTTATSGDVVWQLATICVADAETDDPAFNTASTVTDTAKGTTNQTNDAAITTVTVTGCAAGELMHIKILRDAAHASDSLAATARLIGVELVIREAI